MLLQRMNANWKRTPSKNKRYFNESVESSTTVKKRIRVSPLHPRKQSSLVKLVVKDLMALSPNMFLLLAPLQLAQIMYLEDSASLFSLPLQVLRRVKHSLLLMLVDQGMWKLSLSLLLR
jgi:hypothetical protein